MILTLWRHGEAGSAMNDELRELTPRGADDIGFGGRQFRAACQHRGLVPPAAILHSPLLRAVQTAEILAGVFTHAQSSASAVLKPDVSADTVDRALQQGASDADQHILLVHHQPLVSLLIDYYLGETSLVPFLNPGGLATLDMPVIGQSCASLLFWSLPPEYEVGL